MFSFDSDSSTKGTQREVTGTPSLTEVGLYPSRLTLGSYRVIKVEITRSPSNPDLIRCR